MTLMACLAIAFATCGVIAGAVAFAPSQSETPAAAEMASNGRVRVEHRGRHADAHGHAR